MQNTAKPRVALVLCGVLRDEFAALAASRPNVLHVEVLEQGLHNTPDLLRTTLQQAIDKIERRARLGELILRQLIVARPGKALERIKAQRVKQVAAAEAAALAAASEM